MILSATLSKPTAAVCDRLGNDFVRIKIKLLTASKSSADEPRYFAELFTKTQVFHKKLTAAEVDDFLAAHAGTTFHACVERTETEEITILANKKGKVTRLVKPLVQLQSQVAKANAPASESHGKRNENTATFQIGRIPSDSLNRTKHYIIPEGEPVPFLVHLGVMTAQGKVIAAKYDKFRQINRFLEYVDDILSDLLSAHAKDGIGALENSTNTQASPLHIVDFGSGKSYLTFAVHYFLTEIRHVACEITGLDLKEDVIAYCNRLASQCNCKNLHFKVGDISQYGEKSRPDLVITLHACDTATDYALHYAITHEATAILSVPCCQHELNGQLKYNKDSPFAPLLKHGILKERFSALATDALRAEYLEAAGYKVQVLEFIDISHTPKNLLIRAVKKQEAERSRNARTEADAFTDALGVSQTLGKLLGS
ncbi:MAG: SAM-dependent methyltransferase [Treponema sp.]|nr:SAM-dependent methyltransferase [Treponema sp.]